MNYLKLKKHIIALATLPEDRAPLISAYFDLSRPRQQLQRELEAWASLARHSFTGQGQQDFDDALEEVVDALRGSSGGRGLAVFSRWGEYPLCLPLQFQAPLETSFHAGTLPVIYPLVELKDRFDRFVLVVTNSELARIYEVNLGKASETLLAKRPELRERLGREWTREHYQNHRSHRDAQFVKEKVAVIERLMAKRGHNSLVLAGEPRYVNRLRQSLPKHLKPRIVGEVRTGVHDQNLPNVVEQAMHSFLDQESRDSHNAVRLLDEAVRRRGLAAVGLAPTLAALGSGQADLLIISGELPDIDREMLVREAARHDVRVETVSGSELLKRNGGAGCLLRYALEEAPLAQVEPALAATA